MNKMRKIFFVIVLLFCLTVPAQDADQKFLDSMQLVIKNAKTDYKKARSILLLSDYWSYRDTAKAFQQIREVKKYINNDPSLQGLSLIYEAGIIYDHDIQKSQELYLKAEKLLKDIPTQQVYRDRATLWHNFAALEKVKGNSKKFIDITVKKCIPLAEKAGNKVMVASFQTDMGLTLLDMREFGKSEYYLLSALKTLKSVKNSDIPLTWTYINLANHALTTNKINSAGEYLQLAETLLHKYP